MKSVLLMILACSSLCEIGHRASPSKIKEAKRVLRDLVMRSWKETALGDDIKDYDRRKLDTPNPYHDSRYLFGDVLMTSKQVEDIIIGAKSQLSGRRYKRRVAGGGSFELWPKEQPIGYQFRPNVSENMQNLTRQAMQHWENNTCIRFQESDKAPNRLAFQNGPQCASYVGMSGGAQAVEIADPTCASVGIIGHEIGHALGFFHEHTRPNRDMYIRLNVSNIGFGALDNFAILMPEYLHSLAQTASYEYGSIMHYSAFAFANNESVPTILPQTDHEGYQWTMGQRQGPTFLDYYQINQIYCDNSCEGYATSCRNGGYPNPNACWRCLCPSGFAGLACEKIETSRNCPGAGVIRVMKGLQNISTPRYPREYSTDSECIWLLKTDVNSVIRYEISEDFDLPCDRVCQTSFLEIKAEKNWQRTGHRYCCNGIPFEGTRDSKGNQMVVMLRNDGQKKKGFKMNFWAVPMKVRTTLETTTSRPSNGSMCDFLKSVNLYPCKNGGKCKPTGTTAFLCACLIGYTGFLCEKEINECESSPCQNGGTCLDKVGTYQCTCLPSFTGTQCQTEIDFCSGDPCRNGGICKNATASHYCICLPNYVGPNCETKDRCLWLAEMTGSTPCFNGGTCTNMENGHRCQCLRGYSGVACETASNEPLKECRANLKSATGSEMDKHKKMEECQEKMETRMEECEAKTLSGNKKKKITSEKRLVQLANCDHPPSICRLKWQNYKFAIIGGYNHPNEITFWNASDGTSHSVRNESWRFSTHSAAVLPDNTVLVTGGYPYTDEFYLFNLSAGVNVLMSGKMPGPPRRKHGSAALSDGRVIVCGGETKDGTTISLCIQYKNGRWNEVPSMVSKRRFFGMTSDGRYLYVMGGVSNNRLSSAEYYDTNTDSWTNIQPLPKGPRSRCPSVHVNGKVYAIGGFNGSYLKRVEILDTTSKHWTDGPSLNTNRVEHSAVATPDGSIWVFGGRYGSRSRSKSVEVLPAGGDKWIPWPHKLPRRVANAQVVLV